MVPAQPGSWGVLVSGHTGQSWIQTQACSADRVLGYGAVLGDHGATLLAVLVAELGDTGLSPYGPLGRRDLVRATQPTLTPGHQHAALATSHSTPAPLETRQGRRRGGPRPLPHACGQREAQRPGGFSLPEHASPSQCGNGLVPLWCGSRKDKVPLPGRVTCHFWALPVNLQGPTPYSCKGQVGAARASARTNKFPKPLSQVHRGAHRLKTRPKLAPPSLQGSAAGAGRAGSQDRPIFGVYSQPSEMSPPGWPQVDRTVSPGLYANILTLSHMCPPSAHRARVGTGCAHM